MTAAQLLIDQTLPSSAFGRRLPHQVAKYTNSHRRRQPHCERPRAGCMVWPPKGLQTAVSEVVMGVFRWFLTIVEPSSIDEYRGAEGETMEEEEEEEEKRVKKNCQQLWRVIARITPALRACCFAPANAMRGWSRYGR
ncbi:hypothetical protein Nepgr_014498 [Nepenthes gracilis]|uniref:Uncharacterized protein n=1 Tax=Nepenthes gracilis TaxID=150966 RepID=A0AAD3XPJ7_NEPGR|nr:hypothetical protein Nepgr_014498 [Nepenthes gracilis]